MITSDFKKKLLFGYLACQRLLPNYAFFSKKFKFGNSEILKEYLHQVRAILLDSNTKFDFGSFDSITAKISPLPHNYNTVLASSAMDACSSVFELLSYINDKDNKRIQDIATFATDTVDMYIQEKENLNMNDKNLETVIASHPLMIREKQVQESVWKYLQGAKTIEKEDVDILEKMQLNNGKGNLDLPIL